VIIEREPALEVESYYLSKACNQKRRNYEDTTLFDASARNRLRLTNA